MVKIMQHSLLIGHGVPVFISRQGDAHPGQQQLRQRREAQQCMPTHMYAGKQQRCGARAPAPCARVWRRAAVLLLRGAAANAEVESNDDRCLELIFERGLPCL